MKLFVNLFMVSLFSVTASANTNVECTAISRTNDGEKKVEKTIPHVFESNNFSKWEADIGLISFSVLFDKEREDYRLMITKGPDYRDGTALRGAFPKSKELRASLVSPYETYQIICRQN